MEKSKVVLIPCAKYDDELVYEKVKEGLNLLGGLESIVGTNEKVLVKPNLLSAADSSKGITTNPSVFGAVLRCLKEGAYANVVYGDSGGSSSKDNEKTAQIAGLSEVAEKYGIGFADFKTSVNIEYKEGMIAKNFVLAKAAVDADAIISVCKMKTHALTKITGAIKNQYGLVYSINKAAGHAKYPTVHSFAKMLVDLDKCVKPRLYIMDGVIAMEGNGPASGDLVHMGVLLISTDPVALDSVFARLINLNPLIVAPIYYGAQAGLGNASFDNIEILTAEGVISADDAFEKYGKADFNVDRTAQKFWKLDALFAKKRMPNHKPVVDLEKCVGCGICQEACPVEGKAVHSGEGKKAKYDYNKCIRCYCCQEMCPAKAITREG